MKKRVFDIPHKPSDMPLSTWSALLKGQCEINCSEQCDTKLEVDHHNSRGLGGEASLANCRLICASKNRSRGKAPDPKWKEKNYFDGCKSFDRLRKMQNECGPAMAQRYSDLFVGEGRKKLIASGCSLFAMTCGAGKTMTMISLMFAINHVVNKQEKFAPRCKNVLWLVDQRNLTKLLRKELEDEITKFGLHDSSPNIKVCTTTGDIDRGPGHDDIVISCPHSLWARAKQKRSDAEIQQLLSQYDVIIFDECDFADQQVNGLVTLAPHSLKFGITASPINYGGDIIRNFVLAAVASYDNVYNFDSCLKPMLPWAEAQSKGYIVSVTHDGFTRQHGNKKLVTPTGTHGEKYSFPGAMAAILKAIVSADKHEQKMRKVWPKDWFSPHLIVRCSTISEANQLCEQTNDAIKTMNLKGDGWEAHAITSDPESDEPSLNEKHPFFDAKNNDGRCGKNSARILFVVKMAIRGINNWPLLYIVDIMRADSVISQVQFVGRISRLPERLKRLKADEHFEEFLHGRYFYPVGDEKQIGEMKAAYDFVHETDERFKDADLRDWDHLLSGDLEAPQHKHQGTSNPFTATDEIRLDEEIGRRIKNKEIEREAPTDDVVEDIISTLPGDKTGWRRENAGDYIRNVLGNRSYRASRVKCAEPHHPVSHEEPKALKDYTVEELQEFAREDDELRQYVDKIKINVDVRDLIAMQKREEDSRHYRAQPRLWQLNDTGSEKKGDKKFGIIPKIEKSLWNELQGTIDLDYEHYGKVASSVKSAIAEKFGVGNVEKPTRNNGELDTPEYHHAINRFTAEIKRIAIGILIRRGVMGNMAHLYADVIKDDDSYDDAAE